MSFALQNLLRYIAFSRIQAIVFFSYPMWFWMNLFSQVIGITVVVYFWRAIYSQTSSIAGLDLSTTLNYILVARVLGEVGESGIVWYFGHGLSSGDIVLEMLRPVNFQAMYYWSSLGRWLTLLVVQLPVLLIAIWFGLKLPTDPMPYVCFTLTFLLGASSMFFFEWLVGCLAFYTTSIWGLGIVLFAIKLFFSGALIPLDMFPDWLRLVAQLLPYQQIVYLPASFLSGIHSPAEAPQIWLGQVLSLAAWGVLSRWVFARAIRVVTVQGG